MYASRLIQELQSLVAEHGDLPVTLGVPSYEYSASTISYLPEGPMPNVADIQKQSPPDRFMIEAKDDVEDAR